MITLHSLDLGAAGVVVCNSFFDTSCVVGATKSHQPHTCVILGGRRQAGQP
jgi:hypothetical protein